MVTLVEKSDRLCAAGLLPNPNTVAADLPSRVPPPMPRQVVTEPYTVSPLPVIFAGAGFGIVAAAAALDRHDRRAFFSPPLSP